MRFTPRTRDWLLRKARRFAMAQLRSLFFSRLFHSYAEMDSSLLDLGPTESQLLALLALGDSTAPFPLPSVCWAPNPRSDSLLVQISNRTGTFRICLRAFHAAKPRVCRLTRRVSFFDNREHRDQFGEASGSKFDYFGAFYR